MSESDLPRGTAEEPLTFNEGVSALEDMLDGPKPDPVEIDEDQSPGDDSEEPEGDEDEVLENDDDDDESEDSDETDDEDDDDDTDSITLDDEVLVDLGNGKRASLAELKADYGQVQKRVADFQRDYTQKTDALSKDRQEIEVQQQRVMNWAKATKQKVDLVTRLEQKLITPPPPPEMLDEDPVGYMRQEADHKRSLQEYHFLQQTIQQEQQRTQAELAEADEQFLAEQKQRMFESMPELADPKKFDAFSRDLGTVFTSSYGFTPEEISTVRDARFAKVMRDAIAYQKIIAGKKTAQTKISNKPPVLKSGQSMSHVNKSAKGKKQRTEALRKTGSLEAGISALMDLDL